MNAADDENVPLELDFADGLGVQAVIRGGDLTRLQRASKGSRESASRGRDDVVERCGMLIKLSRRELVMIRHCAVRTEDNRLALDGQIRPANRPFHPLDTHFGSVYNVSHTDLRTRSYSSMRRPASLSS